MGFTGMDAAVIERISRDLQRCSTRITGVVTNVDSVVNQTQENWLGQDAKQFATDWHSDRSTLSNLASSLASLSRTAGAQAAEQRRASGGPR